MATAYRDAAKVFFSRIAQDAISIRGFEGRAPLFYHDIDVMAGVYLANLDACRSLLPTARHYPLQPLPGLGAVFINCLEYRDSDIGPYNEVALAIPVSYDQRPLPGLLAFLSAFWRRRLAAHVVQLPVTTEVALYGGIDYFNFPKYLADIAFAQQGQRRVCRLSDRQSGEIILTASGHWPQPRAGPADGGTDTIDFLAFPCQGDDVLEARLQMLAPKLAWSFGRPDLGLALGAHPKTEEWRRLEIGRQLCGLAVRGGDAVLYLPKRCGRES